MGLLGLGEECGADMDVGEEFGPGTGPREVGESKIGEEAGGGCCSVWAT